MAKLKKVARPAKKKASPYTASMPKALKTKWVKALRSGKYKQGIGSLRARGDGKYEYCCLGVLCEVGGERPKNTGYPSAAAYKRLGVTNYLRDRATGESRGDFALGDDVASELNDDDLASFKKIADLIVKHVKGV